MEETKGMRWQDWFNLILGTWLVIMPFVGVIPLATPAAINGFFFGSVIAAISVAALVWELRWEEWINFGIGLWLVFAPFVLGSTLGSMATWSYVAIGFFIAGDALWAALTSRTSNPPTVHKV